VQFRRAHGRREPAEDESVTRSRDAHNAIARAANGDLERSLEWRKGGPVIRDTLRTPSALNERFPESALSRSDERFAMDEILENVRKIGLGPIGR
jgi:hypothetical protein